MNIKRYVLSDREERDLRLMGVTSFCELKTFKVDTVLGVHFRGGEWGNHRCGSVITTMYLPSGFAILYRQRVPESGR